MSDLAGRSRHAILALGLLQGLLLVVAHTLLGLGVWRAARDLVWLVPWYTVAIGVPAALQLLVTDVRDRRVWLFGLGLLAVLGLTGAYAGYAVEPSLDVHLFPLLTPYVLTTLIGWYVLLPFVQAWFKTGRLQPDYTDLFEFAWNNIITLLIAGIFTGIFWALLALWAALFNQIGIGLFSLIFYNGYFGYSVTAAVFAFALALGRTHAGAIVTVRRVVLAVFKGLLPLLAVIVLLFLAALPLMGLEPLWATRAATGLMLTLQILLIIFLNAVFQNGQGEAPYTDWLRVLVQAAVALLPIYTALCFYALYLRIEQHGWSTDRFWAVLLTIVVGLHVVGYAVAAVRRSNVWMAGMASVNVTIAAVVVALSVAVSSPLLDAHRIGTASQVGRLLAGRIEATDFDYAYLRFDLGRRGNVALARLKDLDDHPQAAAIRKAAELTLARTNRYEAQPDIIRTAAQAAAHFSVYPRGVRLDDSFLAYAVKSGAPWQLKRCLELGQRCAVLTVDLNRDNQIDYVVFRVVSRWDRFAAVLTRVGNDWQFAGSLEMGGRDEPPDLEALEAQLQKGDYVVADNPWHDLRIGDRTRRFRPY